MTEQIRVSQRASESSCPLCREELHSQAELATCGGCETRYHASCFSELGGCSTLGCGETQTEAPSEFLLRPTSDGGVRRGIAAVLLVVLGFITILGGLTYFNYQRNQVRAAAEREDSRLATLELERELGIDEAVRDLRREELRLLELRLERDGLIDVSHYVELEGTVWRGVVRYRTPDPQSVVTVVEFTCPIGAGDGGDWVFASARTRPVLRAKWTALSSLPSEIPSQGW